MFDEEYDAIKELMPTNLAVVLYSYDVASMLKKIHSHSTALIMSDHTIGYYENKKDEIFSKISICYLIVRLVKKFLIENKLYFLYHELCYASMGEILCNKKKSLNL